MNYLRFLWVSLGLQWVVFSALYILSPDLRSWLTAEDKLIENLSALFFLGGGILAFWLVLRSESCRLAWLVIALLGLVGCLDEISFGERFFQLKMPYVTGKKVDGLHDLIDVASNIFQTRTALAVLASVVFLGLAAGVVYLLRKQIWRACVTRPYPPPYAALLSFTALVGAAVLLDLHWLPHFAGDTLIEELLEMSAAWALLASGLYVIGMNQASKSRKPTASGPT